jgi:hypothetical protein
MKSLMDIRKEEERVSFLKLTPLERITTMHNRFLEILAIKARAEGVSEYEIYKRYLKNKDKKLLESSRKEKIKEMPEEYI